MMNYRFSLVGFWVLAVLLFLSACQWSAAVSTPAPTGAALPSPSSVATAIETAAAPTLVASTTPTLFEPLLTATPTVLSPTVTTTAVSGAPVKIVGIHMFTHAAGWAVGTQDDIHQVILRSVDGGVSWKVFSPPESNTENLQARTFFLDEKRAWVTYAGDPSAPGVQPSKVWRTNDGGLHWASSEPDVSDLPAEYHIPDQLGFFDEQHGWLWMHLGAGMMHDYIAIYTTADGGESWKRVVDPGTGNLPMSCYKNAVWFRDAEHGFVAGSCSGVQAGLFFYQSADGGMTWDEVHLPDPVGGSGIFSRDGLNNSAEALVFFSPDQGNLIVSSMDSNQGQELGQRWIYATHDGGMTWTSQPLPGYWGEVTILDDRKAWFLMHKDRETEADLRLYQTVDGGMSWKFLIQPDWHGQIQFVDGLFGWVIAHSGDQQDFMTTHDSGTTWKILKTVIIP